MVYDVWLKVKVSGSGFRVEDYGLRFGVQVTGIPRADDRSQEDRHDHQEGYQHLPGRGWA